MYHTVRENKHTSNLSRTQPDTITTRRLVCIFFTFSTAVVANERNREKY